MNNNADIQQKIRDLLLRDLKQEAASFQKLKGGRNSQVFRLDCGGGSVFAAKVYFRSDRDPRDRVGCEFRALSFLKSEGISEIPAPRAIDEPNRIAIYEFVNGQPLASDQITDNEISQAIEFLRELKMLADSGKAPEFPPASEACFSISSIFQNIDARLKRLEEASAEQSSLADFLRDELKPAREHAEDHCRKICAQHNVSLEAELPLSEQTLSPSDFGFHNTLLRQDGRLVFLDFEYFGWDDPAKTISDFLLHPAMQLSRALKEKFFTGAIAAFNLPKLSQRVRAVYPLFAIKWCAILLNEFTLEHRARRCFADDASGAWNESVQLEKARAMLTHLTNDNDVPWRG